MLGQHLLLDSDGVPTRLEAASRPHVVCPGATGSAGSSGLRMEDETTTSQDPAGGINLRKAVDRPIHKLKRKRQPHGARRDRSPNSGEVPPFRAN